MSQGIADALGRLGAKMNTLALLAEHAQDLDRTVAGRTEPVRVLGVELSRFTCAHDNVMFA